MLINRLISILCNDGIRYSRIPQKADSGNRIRDKDTGIQRCSREGERFRFSEETSTEFPAIRQQSKEGNGRGIDISPFQFTLLIFLTIMVVYTIFQQAGYLNFYDCPDPNVSIDDCIQKFNSIGVYR